MPTQPLQRAGVHHSPNTVLSHLSSLYTCTQPCLIESLGPKQWGPNNCFVVPNASRGQRPLDGFSMPMSCRACQAVAMHANLALSTNAGRNTTCVHAAQVLEGLLAEVEYSRVVYLGDGSGDVCPCMRLRPVDFVLARECYPTGSAPCGITAIVCAPILRPSTHRNGLPPGQQSIS